MKNCELINLKAVGDEKLGYLVPLEYRKNIDFDIKRVYYTYDVPCSAKRGHHAHKTLFQLLICLAGSVTVECFDGKEKKTFYLNTPTQGLLVGPMIWHDMFEYTSDAKFVVLASDYYEESDYIRDFSEFLSLANKEQ
ncbi:MAG: sugar 3,4-ketoisomerase [Clostridium sp.]